MRSGHHRLNTCEKKGFIRRFIKEASMALMKTPAPQKGAAAPDFDLPGVDGRRWTLAGARGEKGLLVMFICNHCPYVKAIADRLAADMKALQQAGIGVIAVRSE